ncbi:tRNA dihydrouridine(20/20a) synthase DusA [Paraneptunicella aestuarii]|uniref:tRNA dihydrouridine(20/20a) synthase DusA n=1 Tax=Paraneptunicella aestuarii TaxID=2831148 RepID=UPI001E34D28E|nr:tRNA dihydrouridine(20/20a) synthase DusA [Paraneptunicella aestuarii]UAA39340.1 tRNA dihydrouridine(20/20a) synthase DusA [Paraneptunicella aestuarii]
MIDRRFSVAPMLDWTDRHCRYFLRLMSRNALLYTEMVTTGAIIHGKGDFLGYNQEEHPVALQLGGSEPELMAECAVRAQEYGYDEVNINVGCPSDRVQNGSFGACLMAEPETVAACVKAMQDKVSIPVTVKCRIGIDDMDDYKDLTRFVQIVADAGCETFIVHARKAWLQGLSPKQNREIPPLMYDRVYHLKQEFPHLHISINGGVKTLGEVEEHLQHVDGVMVGREVYANPYIMADVDKRIYADDVVAPDREAVVRMMMPYIDRHIEKGGRAWHVLRHMIGIFQGQPAGRVWRRFLSENAVKPDTDSSIVEAALDAMAQTKRHIADLEERRLQGF